MPSSTSPKVHLSYDSKQLVRTKLHHSKALLEEQYHLLCSHSYNRRFFVSLPSSTWYLILKSFNVIRRVRDLNEIVIKTYLIAVVVLITTGIYWRIYQNSIHLIF